MTFGQLLAFNVALLVAIASPGPALLMALRTTLSGGRRAGIAVGAGLGLMAATWTLIALLGLGVVFELFPAVYVAARIAGAGYLLYLAYRIWRDASAPVEARGTPARHAFRQGSSSTCSIRSPFSSRPPSSSPSSRPVSVPWRAS